MLTKTLNAYPFTIRPIMRWENQTPHAWNFQSYHEMGRSNSIFMESSFLSRDDDSIPALMGYPAGRRPWTPPLYTAGPLQSLNNFFKHTTSISAYTKLINISPILIESSATTISHHV
jgi:hypothetical protein